MISAANSRDHDPFPYAVDVLWHSQESWEDQVEFLESWLDRHIGVGEWSWSWHTLKQAWYCGVRFRQAQSLCIFLLSFGEGIYIRPMTIKSRY